MLAGSISDYPAAFSTFDGNVVDVGGTIGGVVPLPFGRRHTLRADLRGRALLAESGQDTGLLQLGGDANTLGPLYSNTWTTGAPPTFDSSRFPPNLRFVEPLRGYEDFPITTDRATIIDLAWRYPLIIDRGVAALWFLPAEFVRELDVELFGSGALDRANARHAAAGGALTLRVQALRVPLVVTYQLARRLLDDAAIVQLVGIAPDF